MAAFVCLFRTVFCPATRAAATTFSMVLLCVAGGTGVFSRLGTGIDYLNVRRETQNGLGDEMGEGLKRRGVYAERGLVIFDVYRYACVDKDRE